MLGMLEMLGILGTLGLLGNYRVKMEQLTWKVKQKDTTGHGNQINHV